MKRLSSRKIAAITNCVLVLVLALIGTVCFLPAAESVSGVEDKVYYKGSSEDGVSLMFNVYWGTEEVRGILNVLDENVDCLKEIAARGHEIASHGYFHRDHDKLDYNGNLQEIKTSVDFIRTAAGVTVTLFAPPSGAYSDDTVKAAESLGLRTVMWSRDTIDWRDKDAATCFSRATKNIGGGDLVLMHPMKHTLAALPKILTVYRENGLRAVTVSENLG